MSVEWISVKDKLPEPLVDVLIVYAPDDKSKNLYVDVSTMFEDGSWATFEWLDVRYWTPLPKPPKD